MNSSTELVSFSTEFPRHILPLLRCRVDGGELILKEQSAVGSSGLTDGFLSCSRCRTEYRIESGILRMLPGDLSGENTHEIECKNQEYLAMSESFVSFPIGWRSELKDRIEIPPHLEALGPLEGKRVLEFGCGDGRFTLLMAQLGAEVLAVDFSIEGLRRLSRNLSSGVAPTTYKVRPRLSGSDLRGRVGLVQADASQFRAAPRSFDRALSATPLDGRDERMTMFRNISDALKDDGRFVGGVEHDDLRRRALGLPVARRYSPGGIFIEHFTTPAIRREVAPFFGRIRVRPIRAHVPFLQRLPIKLVTAVSLVIAAIPGLRQLGEILLMSAERPIRSLEPEGVSRPGNRAIKGIYLWFKRRRGEEIDRELQA